MIVLGIAIAIPQEIEALRRTKTITKIEIHPITEVHQGIEVEAFHAGEVSREVEVEIIIARE